MFRIPILLQAAISNMDGVGGKPAWAWIFILEGLLTVVAGAMSFWIIQDFPDTAKFLTEEESESSTCVEPSRIIVN